MKGESEPAIADDEAMKKTNTRERREFIIVIFAIFPFEVKVEILSDLKTISIYIYFLRSS